MLVKNLLEIKVSENKWINQIFKSIDAKQTSAFVANLDSNCHLQFGNMPAVEGKENIMVFIDQFFNSIAGLSHRLTDVWTIAEATICHGEVTYKRMDGSTLTVPFANVMKGQEQNICEYLIFADTSELYANDQ